MGRGTIEADLFRSERYEIEQRTSDPPNPAANEEWLRVDIKPNYEDADGNTQTGVAEYRCANADGTVDTVPVASLGDTVGSTVIDKVRTYVDAGGSPTGVGFIPYTTGSASYPKRKLEHPTAGEVSMHDQLTELAIPDSGVFRLTLDNADTESGTALDSWSGLDATINGATTGVAGANQTYTTNEAYSFDGTDDYLVRDGSEIPDLSAPYTASAWINPNSIGEYKDFIVFGQQSNNITNLRFSLNTDGTLKLRLYDGSTSPEGHSTGSVTFGSWAHVVVVAESSDPNDYTFYIDGSDAGLSVVDDQTASFSPVNRYTIGAYRDPTFRLFDGEIDDPRTYDKALTATEVSDLYNTGSI